MKYLVYVSLVLGLTLAPFSAFAQIQVCQPGDNFNALTGAPCNQKTACQVGDLYNIYTGSPCTSQTNSCPIGYICTPVTQSPVASSPPPTPTSLANITLSTASSSTSESTVGGWNYVFYVGGTVTDSNGNPASNHKVVMSLASTNFNTTFNDNNEQILTPQSVITDTNGNFSWRTSLGECVGQSSVLEYQHLQTLPITSDYTQGYCTITATDQTGLTGSTQVTVVQ